MNFTILHFEQLDSTNTEALDQAKRGANEGLCIVARRQSAGKGRHGRAWISEKDAGLFFSLVLRPKIETRFLTLITLMTAVAVHDTLETLYQINCDIKWVNDILVSGQKICGILAETCETPRGLAIIVGIGINLRSSNFPAELSKIATSVENETGKKPDIKGLLQKLTGFLAQFYTILQGENGAAAIRQEWSERSSYAFGKRVKVLLENETIFGTTRGIEENGALRIEPETGEIRLVYAGEVENLREH